MPEKFKYLVTAVTTSMQVCLIETYTAGQALRYAHDHFYDRQDDFWTEPEEYNRVTFSVEQSDLTDEEVEAVQTGFGGNLTGK